MIKPILAAACLAAAAASGASDNPDPARSVLFTGEQEDRSYLTTLPEGHDQNRGDRCMELLREADALKGRPQQRSAVMQRWQAECSE